MAILTTQALSLLVLFLITVLTLTAQPSCAAPPGPAKICGTTLKNIGSSLEAYACDHEGRYPDTLNDLCPHYLGLLPQCPINRMPYGYEVSHEPENYTLCCQGWVHRKEIMDSALVGENNLIYTATGGASQAKDPIPAEDEGKNVPGTLLYHLGKFPYSTLAMLTLIGLIYCTAKFFCCRHR